MFGRYVASSPAARAGCVDNVAQIKRAIASTKAAMHLPAVKGLRNMEHLWKRIRAPEGGKDVSIGFGK
jgi:hypothetical protein